jgi:hypothetical protein
MLSPKLLRGLVLALFIVALLPAGALASISVSTPASTGALQIRVDDPSSDVTLSSTQFDTVVTATAPITADGFCSPAPATTLQAICGPTSVAFRSVAITGGSGPDVMHVAPGFPLPITADGGPGDDELIGGEEPDHLIGGAGVDVLDGGAGNDRLDTFDGETDASATCGDGTDELFADNFLDALDFVTCESIAPEFADGDPRILPADPVPGQTLTAVAAPTGTTSSVFLQWLRCGPAGNLVTCDDIDGAEASSYTLSAADVGSTIRVYAEATNPAGAADNVSSPTAVVRGSATPPTPPSVVASQPARAALMGRFAMARCGARVCRVRLTLRGPVTRVRVDLRRGTRRLARVTRQGRAGTMTVTLRAPRRLTPGRYTIVVRLTGSGAPAASLRRMVRVR